MLFNRKRREGAAQIGSDATSRAFPSPSWSPPGRTSPVAGGRTDAPPSITRPAAAVRGDIPRGERRIDEVPPPPAAAAAGDWCRFPAAASAATLGDSARREGLDRKPRTPEVPARGGPVATVCCQAFLIATISCLRSGGSL